MNLITINKKLNGKIFINGKYTKKPKTNIKITTISPINNITKNSIVYAEKEKYMKIALSSNASTILIPNTIKIPNTKIIIQSKNSKQAFIKLLELFSQEYQKPIKKNIHKNIITGNNITLGKNITIMPYTVIENNVSIGDNTIIYPHCYIGYNTKIGKNSIIHQGVTIHEKSKIGNNVIIQSKSVIGSNGFGYHLDKNKYIKIPHIGNVNIDNNVEIGSGVRIDKATIGTTYIGKGSKIDNLVHIAHNCTIGKNCIIAGQTGLAGSVSLENNISIAGQVGIVNHCHIGNNSTIMAKSMVNHSLKPNSTVFGYPARPIKEAKKIYKAILKLIKP